MRRQLVLFTLQQDFSIFSPKKPFQTMLMLVIDYYQTIYKLWSEYG